MAPDYTINTSEENFKKLIKVADTFGMDYIIPVEEKNVNMIPSRESIKSKYLEVPSIGLAVPKERILLGYNHKDFQDEVHSDNKKMLNIYEFTEFLKEAKEKDIDLYKEITQVRSPWRAEWLDAKFKLEGNKMWIHSNKFTKNGAIVPDYDVLDSNTLMNDKLPGISLEGWVNNPTKQGLPKDLAKEGDLYYWKPRNGAVARFYANGYWAFLDCFRDPSDANSVLGVRAAEQLK